MARQTKKEKLKEKLLEWVTRSGPLLESQVIGSGMSAALNELLIERKLTIIAHPTVHDKGGAPAAGVALYPFPSECNGPKEA